VQKQLGVWHSELARLRASIGARHADGRGLRAKAAALSARVSAAEGAFKATLKDQAAEDIAQHSIVQDAARSLDSLKLLLDELASMR